MFLYTVDVKHTPTGDNIPELHIHFTNVDTHKQTHIHREPSFARSAGLLSMSHATVLGIQT